MLKQLKEIESAWRETKRQANYPQPTTEIERGYLAASMAYENALAKIAEGIRGANGNLGTHDRDDGFVVMHRKLIPTNEQLDELLKGGVMDAKQKVIEAIYSKLISLQVGFPGKSKEEIDSLLTDYETAIRQSIAEKVNALPTLNGEGADVLLSDVNVILTTTDKQGE